MPPAKWVPPARLWILFVENGDGVLVPTDPLLRREDAVQARDHARTVLRRRAEVVPYGHPGGVGG